MVFIAAYGVGQVWSMFLTLRGGNGTMAVVATGVVGAILLAISAVVIGRFLHVLRNKSISTADPDLINGESEDV